MVGVAESHQVEYVVRYAEVAVDSGTGSLGLSEEATVEIGMSQR